MQISGEYLIPADRQAVWTALNDPEALRACIPGCERVIRHEPTRFEALIRVSIGPWRSQISGELQLSDIEVPERYTMMAQTTGKLQGMASARASVSLQDADQGAGTLLSFEAGSILDGILARLGATVLTGTARQYADDFFARFADYIRRQQAEAETMTTASTSDRPTASETTALPDEIALLQQRIARLEQQLDHQGKHIEALGERLALAQGRINPWIWASALVLITAMLIAVLGP